jgi:phosphopantetheinyl transferase (holo-ACP synthase)
MNKIRGIGIDLTKISRFSKIIGRHENSFIHKVLHSKEITNYRLIKTIEERSRFLASRYSNLISDGH